MSKSASHVSEIRQVGMSAIQHSSTDKGGREEGRKGKMYRHTPIHTDTHTQIHIHTPSNLSSLALPLAVPL